VTGEFTAGIFAFLFGVLTVKALIKYKEGWLWLDMFWMESMKNFLLEN
jgi:hypothetical protein